MIELTSPVRDRKNQHKYYHMGRHGAREIAHNLPWVGKLHLSTKRPATLIGTPTWWYELGFSAFLDEWNQSHF